MTHGSSHFLDLRQRANGPLGTRCPISRDIHTPCCDAEGPQPLRVQVALGQDVLVNELLNVRLNVRCSSIDNSPS